MTKRSIDTKTSFNYENNKGKTKTNYGNKNKINNKDLKNVDFKHVDLEITCNNIFLPFS